MSAHLLHTIGPMERWDHLAWRYYGDAAGYGPIIWANRALFSSPLAAIPPVPAPGTVVKIPILDPASQRPRPEDLPPWLR